MFLFVFGVRESIGVILKPVFILVRPQMGENIGSAARAMLNFGIDSLRIVNPRDGWPNPKAKALASGAGSVLDGALKAVTVEGSVPDLVFKNGTDVLPNTPCLFAKKSPAGSPVI